VMMLVTAVLMLIRSGVLSLIFEKKKEETKESKAGTM
jgi:hypothetical protein